MQIPINIEVLKSVHAITEDEAKRIIGQTDGLRINDITLVEPKRQKEGFTWDRMDQGITVEELTNLSDGLLVIELFDKPGQSLASLLYDMKAGEFRQRVPDPEPAASPPTNPQAEIRRDLEVALQIGNKAALYVFLAHHPEGLYADLAKARLETMP